MLKKRFIKILISIVICVAVGAFAAMYTQSTVNTWYPTLNKPFFNPPNWLFAPVWTFLYILMGIALGIVWSKGFYDKRVRTALYFFALQLILNAGWSVLFFGLKQPFWALVEIIALFIVLLFTYRRFKVVDKRAAYLLIPYIAWVAFATALNFEIWRLN